MKYSKDKQIAALVRDLIQNGWHYRTGRRHGKLTCPTGRTLSVPCTPSDRRAFLNFRRDVLHLTKSFQ
ncbi:MAG: hypothetical protein KDE68_00465 [Rhodocyclaceae bacterium]|nr:hypothetical protein [Rhodocyclaceae bacterium]